MSKLDHIYRSLLMTKFFVRGWGKPENLKRIFEFRKIISDREKCKHLVARDYPIHIDKDIIQKECRIIEGHFKSPFVDYLPGIMPREVEKAHFQMILPKTWESELKPVCIQLAGTGDHFFWRRRSLLARPLLKESGIASIILENPYYGLRKPKQQLRSSLHNVSDLLVMGGALVLESLALLHWCERQGYGPLGITGISMGGFMASLAATNWHKPLALIPCLSWSTASSVFTRGVMSGAIPWKLLQDQYAADSIYEQEITKLIVSPEEMKDNAAFQLGRDVARRYPESVEALSDYQSEHRTSHTKVVRSDLDTAEGGHAGVDDSFSASVPLKSDQSVPLGNAAQAGGSHADPDTRKMKYHTSSALNAPSPSPRLNCSNSRTYTSTIESVLHALRLQRVRSIFGDKWTTVPKNAGNIQKEALWFMRGVMDDCTHLGNFTCPVDPSLVIIVAAQRDAYVPRDSVLSLQDMWPGAEVRYLDTGHISAFLFRQAAFRRAIADAFDKQIHKYYS